MKFSNPIPGSKVQTSTLSKTVELSSFPNDYVVAPYDGIIIEYNPNICNGLMKIKHVVDNHVYFSKLCNIISPTSFFSGVKVREGQTIGQIGSKNLEYTITDSNDIKQDVTDFLSGNFKTSKEKNKEKDFNNLKNKSGDKEFDSLSNALLKGMLFPFGVVSSALKKKDEKKENDQLSEQIKRIKTLLK